ncbi:MAG TPA: alpha-amylase domain-containing protein, partial [Lunatimonas sp.]|nr:alpha-amylase domain-containing protein [Lunatimonas sp.]
FDDKNAIGWIREGDEDHSGSGMGVLLTNGSEATKWMKIGEKYAGKTLYDFLGNSNGTIIVNDDGWAPFRVNGGSVSVWVFQG